MTGNTLEAPMLVAENFGSAVMVLLPLARLTENVVEYADGSFCEFALY